MLMQNFKSASDLEISEPQKEALIKTLALLETGKLQHNREMLDSDDPRNKRKFSGLFNMNAWAGHHDCGTVACIGGTAELIGDVRFGSDYGAGSLPFALNALFCPREIVSWKWDKITPAQAATALRSYLTAGDARWDLALA